VTVKVSHVKNGPIDTGVQILPELAQAPLIVAGIHARAELSQGTKGPEMPGIKTGKVSGINSEGCFKGKVPLLRVIMSDSQT
jgi:hypothetical protein